MEELLNATPMNPSHPFAQLSNKFQQPIQAVDVQKAKKSPVTKVKTSNENPSSAELVRLDGSRWGGRFPGGFSVGAARPVRPIRRLF